MEIVNLMLILLPVIPIFTAICSYSVKNRLYSHIISIIGAVVTIFIIFIIPNQDFFIVLHKITNRYLISIMFDSYIKSYLITIAILWLITLIYCTDYLRHNIKNKIEFVSLINLSISPTIIAAMAGDFITMLIGYELLTIITYPLVVNFTSNENKFAVGKYYLMMLIGLPLLFMLPAIIMITNVSGNNLIKFSYITPKNHLYYFIAICLFLLGNVKVAYIPVHSWLPKAMIAPIPVSAILHAVAVVNTGIIVAFKLISYKIGGYQFSLLMKHYNDLATALQLIFCFTAICAGVLALFYDELKTILAYSTISQLSYMMIILTCGSYNFEQALIYQLISHSIAKITLFFVVGMLSSKYNIKRVTDLGIFLKENYFALLAYIVASVSIIGLPFTIGGTSKELIKTVIKHNNTLSYTITICSALSLLYLFRPMYYLAFRNQNILHKPDSHDKFFNIVFVILTILCFSFI